jgi:hypothetical protein
MPPRRGRGAAAAARPLTPEPPSEPESESEPDPTGPAVIVSPVKARKAKRGIAAQSDIAVWGQTDKAIIG